MAIISPSRATGEVFGVYGKPVNFGFITDTHHDPIKADAPADQGGKYYQAAAGKVADIAAIFNARTDLSFCFQNGDFIDGSADEATALVDLATIVAAYDCTVPVYHNIGNHEVPHLTKEQVMAITGQPSKYYQFRYGGVRFIVLDGNYLSDDDNDDLSVSSGQGGVSPFTSYVPPIQLAWLEQVLANSPEPCVIFCHYPIYYVGGSAWGLTNAAAVRTVLEASGKVIACIGGHLHDNYIRKLNDILYVNLHATTTGASSLNYAIISVYPRESQIKVFSAGYDTSYITAE